jgi:uroporphyrin-III C-methyltransferase
MDMQPDTRLLPPPRPTAAAGAVYLVGTGPGDPELLTLRALRLIEAADVVLFDHLVASEILALLPAAAEKIYVGKRRSQHALRQEAINALMVDLARVGRCVLRLKGGDPFIFGRGGEEIRTLSDAGIPFQIVPGITAALGAAAYTGIPLTHRDHAQACTFVTGNLQDGSVDLDWPGLARPRQTLVVYMGLMALPQLCEKLIEHGRAPDTPAAVVQNATRPDQYVVVATLRTLPQEVALAGMKAPTVILVGEVVALHRQLAWFTTQSTGS